MGLNLVNIRFWDVAYRILRQNPNKTFQAKRALTQRKYAALSESNNNEILWSLKKISNDFHNSLMPPLY